VLLQGHCRGLVAHNMAGFLRMPVASVVARADLPCIDAQAAVEAAWKCAVGQTCWDTAAVAQTRKTFALLTVGEETWLLEAGMGVGGLAEEAWAWACRLPSSLEETKIGAAARVSFRALRKAGRRSLMCSKGANDEDNNIIQVAAQHGHTSTKNA
jgi:hypothetical protein